MTKKKADDKCDACDGDGFIVDTTYDRAGSREECGQCFGSGYSRAKIRRILRTQQMLEKRAALRKVDK